MVDVLASSPLLTLFAVVALGTLVGAIPWGPLKFGPAGALFVGLAVGALDPRLGEGLGLIQGVGLGLFVYTIGIAAGASFFRDLKKQTPLMIGASILLVAMTAAVIGAGKIFGIGGDLGGGLFAGALTTTPALAAASAAADGSTVPAVGYSIAYPLGVIITMIVLTFVARVPLPAKNDQMALNSADLCDVTATVTNPMRVDQIPGIASQPGKAGGEVRVSYFLRDGDMTVAHPREQLRAGDQVLIVGIPDAVRTAVDALGHEAESHLAHDRTHVNFRRFIVSNPKLAGRTVADLHIPSRFGSIITRVRRGDQDLLAHAEMPLQLGDRVRVVYPNDQHDHLVRYFGDSEKRITEVDFFSVGIGIALGVALGLVAIPIGGASLALGSAAGPLVVGLILGKLDRTGPLVWTLPNSANLTIRQFGLVVFLAAVGLSSGETFASTAFSPAGITIGLIAIATLTPTVLAFWGAWPRAGAQLCSNRRCPRRIRGSAGASQPRECPHQ